MQVRPPGLPATRTPLADALDIGNTVLQLDTLTQSRLATISTAEIAELNKVLDSVASRIKTAQGEIHKTYASRYLEKARAQLLAKGQDTGTTHILDGDFDITVEIGKDVKYEPKGLTELVAKIEANGGDPREYVEIKYSVSEAKFKAWPQTLRAPFEALRTVTPKAPKFVLRRMDANGEGK